MTAALKLRVREVEWERLHRHLFPGDGDEHGAVLLCGRAGRTGNLLLVREVVLAVDGVDYVPGTRGYRHLRGEFVTRQLRRAKDLGLVYLAVHNHGGEHSVAFSNPDLDSHERSYPTLLAVSGNPVGGVVVARDAIAADVWLPDGTRQPLSGATVVGRTVRQLRDDTSPPVHPTQGSGPVDPRYDRQALLFGAPGQLVLGAATVGIVGAGGVGMLLVQALARVGVGNLVVIDPDRVETTNLPRLPEARRWDALEPLEHLRVPGLTRELARRLATPKVSLARRIARRASMHVRVETIRGDVADDHVARRLLGCDVILLAADTMLARDVVNQIAYQYLIPTWQVGSKAVIEPVTGRVLDTYAVVRSLGTAPGCLRCNGLIDAARLSEEVLASDEQRANQRYVDDPDVHAPSVFTLNAVGAGWVSNEVLHYLTGLGTGVPAFRVLRNRPVSPNVPQLATIAPDADPNCYVCGTGDASTLARGDGLDLPTRLVASDDGRKQRVTDLIAKSARRALPGPRSRHV